MDARSRLTMRAFKKSRTSLFGNKAFNLSRLVRLKAKMLCSNVGGWRAVFGGALSTLNWTTGTLCKILLGPRSLNRCFAKCAALMAPADPLPEYMSKSTRPPVSSMPHCCVLRSSRRIPSSKVSFSSASAGSCDDDSGDEGR